MNLAELDHRHVWHPFTPQRRWTNETPLVIESADGNWLVDDQGNRYLDGVSSLWTNVHGHRHPKLDAAVTAQLGRVAHSTFLGLTHAPGIRLAKRLVDLTPWGLDRVFYSDNGSTAVEVALKMAYQAQQQRGETQRTTFACLKDAYHGDTIGSVSVGAIDLFHSVYRPLLFETVACPAPTFAGGDEEEQALSEALELLDRHGGELVALVVEPLVQGAAGMKMHSPRFIETLLTRARKHGALLIVDEVAVGFGRLGTLFASEKVGIAPDFMCLAKGLSAGYLPLAATITTEAVYEAFLAAPEDHRQFFHGHTFTANPLACAVALASLDVFEDERVLEHVQQVGTQLDHLLSEHLLDLAAVSAIRQHGVMVGIDLVQPDGTPWSAEDQVGHQVAMATRRHGAITRPLGDTLVLNPPLSIQPDEVVHLVHACASAIQEVCA